MAKTRYSHDQRALIIMEYREASDRRLVLEKYEIGSASVISNWIARANGERQPSRELRENGVDYVCYYQNCFKFPTVVLICEECGALFACEEHTISLRRGERKRHLNEPPFTVYALRPFAEN